MKKSRKKVVVYFLTLAMFSFVSGFCVNLFSLVMEAHADNSLEMASQMSTEKKAQDQIEFWNMNEKGNQVLPCCTSQKDNNFLGTENVRYEHKTLFFPAVILNFVSNIFIQRQNRVLPIFLTSPPGGGLVTSTIKLE